MCFFPHILHGGFEPVTNGLWPRPLQVVVLKKYKLSEPHSLRTLKKELNALVQLQHHPNIVSPNLFFVDDSGQGELPAAYIELPFYDQGDMERWLATSPGESEVFFALGDVLRGLDFMHTRGFVHCDVRARNVLVRRASSADGAGWEAALSDFDISIDSGARITRFTTTSTFTTTEAFGGFEGILTMAPEVRKRRVPCSRASDCYSFGGLVFASVFRGAEPEVDDQTDIVAIPPHRDEDLRRLLRELLCPQHEQRPSAAEALAHPAFAAPGQRVREDAFRLAEQVDSELMLLEEEREGFSREFVEQQRKLAEENAKIEEDRGRLRRRDRELEQRSREHREVAAEERAEMQRELKKLKERKAELKERERNMARDHASKERQLSSKGKALQEKEAKVQRHLELSALAPYSHPLLSCRV